MNLASLRSYRAKLVPLGTALDQVEKLADSDELQSLRLRSTNAEQAGRDAHRVTGLPVYSVERVEPTTI